MGVTWSVKAVVGARLSEIGHHEEYEDIVETRYNELTGEPYKKMVGRKLIRETVGKYVGDDWRERFHHHFFSDGDCGGDDHTYIGHCMNEIDERHANEVTEIQSPAAHISSAAQFLKKEFGYEGPISIYLIAHVG